VCQAKSVCPLIIIKLLVRCGNSISFGISASRRGSHKFLYNFYFLFFSVVKKNKIMFNIEIFFSFFIFCSWGLGVVDGIGEGGGGLNPSEP
jgi:hypothetical protein